MLKAVRCFQVRVEVVNGDCEEPNFLMLDFISTDGTGLSSTKGFAFNEIIHKENTNTNFRLIATINAPYVGHFNCALYKPQLSKQDKPLLGWYLHDGLENNGEFFKIHNFKNIAEERPIVLFYQKIVVN